MYKWADTRLFFLHSFLTWQVTLTNSPQGLNQFAFLPAVYERTCLHTALPGGLWWCTYFLLTQGMTNVMSILFQFTFFWPWSEFQHFFSCLRVIFIPLCESLSVQFFSQFFYQVFDRSPQGPSLHRSYPRKSYWAGRAKDNKAARKEEKRKVDKRNSHRLEGLTEQLTDSVPIGEVPALYELHLQLHICKPGITSVLPIS